MSQIVGRVSRNRGGSGPGKPPWEGTKSRERIAERPASGRGRAGHGADRVAEQRARPGRMAGSWTPTLLNASQSGCDAANSSAMLMRARPATAPRRRRCTRLFTGISVWNAPNASSAGSRHGGPSDAEQHALRVCSDPAATLRHRRDVLARPGVSQAGLPFRSAVSRPLLPPRPVQRLFGPCPRTRRQGDPAVVLESPETNVP